MGVLVSTGHAAQLDEQGGWLVPKKNLIGCLRLLLQQKLLTIARSLEHAATLGTELRQFQIKAAPIKPDVLDWRERPHDDLVLALVIAVWQGERFQPFAVWVFDGPVQEPPPSFWWRQVW
jgi:hypothetical protein